MAYCLSSLKGFSECSLAPDGLISYGPPSLIVDHGL